MRREHIVEQIIASAAQLFDLEPAEIVGRSRRREVAAARSAIYYVASKVCPTLTMDRLAQLLGQVDRKSVYNALQRCEQYMQHSIGYRRQVQTLLAEFQPPAEQPQRDTRTRQQSMQLWAELHRGSSAFVKTA